MAGRRTERLMGSASVARDNRAEALPVDELVASLAEQAAARYQRGSYGTQDAIYLTNCAILAVLLDLRARLIADGRPRP
jgi:hypothetical protein